MTVLEQELTVLLEQFEAIWSRLKPTELRGLWDPDEAMPYYIAEEVAAPMYGWNVIEPYWREAEQILLKFTIRTFDLCCKQIAPDLAVMNYIMHWNGQLKGMEHAPMGLDVRVSALLRKTDKGWRFCHYVESPLGAFPYIQATYQANVDREFLAEIGQK
jgi:hypothetical protein